MLGEKYKMKKRIRLLIKNPGYLKVWLKKKLRSSPFGKIDYYILNGKSFAPNSITLFFTYRCNLKCHMCPQVMQDDNSSRRITEIDDRYVKEREMNFVEIKRIVDEVVKCKPKFYLTGGEPLLHRDTIDSIKYIKSRNMVVSLQSNGILLQKYASNIVSSGVDKLIVSIDGPETIHNTIRGIHNAFSLTISGLREVIKIKKKGKGLTPIIEINMVIIKENYKYLLDMIKIASDIGVDALSFQHPVFESKENDDKQYKAYKNAFNAEQRREGYYTSEMVEDDVNELLKMMVEIKKSSAPIEISFFPDIKMEHIKPYYLDLNYPFKNRCPGLWNSCVIEPNGDVSPCMGYVAGNIREENLLSIWNNDKMVRFRKRIKEGLLPTCVRCCNREY